MATYVITVSDSDSCTVQKTIADRFLEKFTLGEQEIKLLSSSSEPVDNDFFAALNHLQQIHNHCQLLLTTKNEKAG